MPRTTKEAPLSVRLDDRAWRWLRRESKRRSEAMGVPIGPSSIVRAIVEREAEKATRAESIADFRKRWKIDELGFDERFFERLRDRAPGRDVRL